MMTRYQFNTILRISDSSISDGSLAYISFESPLSFFFNASFPAA